KALRDTYGVTGDMVFCPAGDGYGSLGREGWVRTKWDQFAITPPDDQGCRMGYLYLAGNSGHPRYPKWNGWGDFPHKTSGFFPPVSAIRDHGFTEGSGARRASAPPDRIPVMKDLS